MSQTQIPKAPQVAPRKASVTRVLLMLIFGGLILAVGGCALFLAYLNVNGGSSPRDALSAAGALLFFGGVLAMIVGTLWMVARVVGRFMQTGKK